MEHVKKHFKNIVESDWLPIPTGGWRHVSSVMDVGCKTGPKTVVGPKCVLDGSSSVYGVVDNSTLVHSRITNTSEVRSSRLIDTTLEQNCNVTQSKIEKSYLDYCKIVNSNLLSVSGHQSELTGSTCIGATIDDSKVDGHVENSNIDDSTIAQDSVVYNATMRLAEIATGVQIRFGKYTGKFQITPLQIVGTLFKLNVNCLSPLSVTVGCQTHELAWWLKFGEDFAKRDEQMSEAAVAEYRAYFDLIERLYK